MDKYTYSVKVEKIQKLVKKGDYAAAVKIADTVDWEEVHSVRLLTITAAAYERTQDYKTAIELLEMAYEESAVGKRILYKLTGLAIADNNVELAQHYYEKYLQEASDENGRYLLRYLIAEKKGEPLDKRIAILETYRKYEFEEQWAIRLAELYDEAGMQEACVKLCDEIILWFGVGPCVDEAMEIKEKYAPLSEEQQERRDNREFYEQRYQNLVEQYAGREQAMVAAELMAKAEAAAEDEEDAGEDDGEELLAAAADDDWKKQLKLIEADSLKLAIEKTLEYLAEYYNEKGKAMGKLSRISAERLNILGMDAMLSNTAGKDLLVDGAAALSDDILAGLVHLIRRKRYPQVIVLTDEATQLAYLDARLGDVPEEKDSIPQIAVSVPSEEAVHLKVDDLVEEAASAVILPAAPAVERLEELLPEQTEDEKVPEMAAEEELLTLPAAEELPEETEQEKEEALPEAAPEQEKEEELPEAAPEQEKEEELPEAAPEQEEREDLPETAMEQEEKTEEPAIRLAVEDDSEAETEEQLVFVFDDIKEETAEKTAEEEILELKKKLAVLEEAAASKASKEKAAPDVKETAEEELPEIVPTETKRINHEAVKAALRTNEEGAPITSTRQLEKIVGMTEEAFAEYAMNYLASIDCVLEEGAEAAIREAAAGRKADGAVLTKELAEDMIEDAADRAEKKAGLFAKRYNKEGNLIIKAKHIL